MPTIRISRLSQAVLRLDNMRQAPSGWPRWKKEAVTPMASSASTAIHSKRSELPVGPPAVDHCCTALTSTRPMAIWVKTEKKTSGISSRAIRHFS